MVQFGRRSRVAWRIFCLCVLSASLCFAQRYSFKHYLQDSGLTNLAVNTINQDDKGFLWVATDNGLFRYNGRRFTRYGSDEGLPQDDVTALAVSRDGAIWAATPAGVAYLQDNRFQAVRLGSDKGLQPHLSSPEPDLVYATTGHALYRIHKKSSATEVTRIFEGEAFGLVADSAERVWFGCGKELCRWENGKTRSVGSQLGLPPDQWKGLVLDHRGALWVRSETRLYSLARGASGFVEHDKGLPASPADLSEMRADSVYGVIVPTDSGLAIPNGGRWRLLRAQNGLAMDATSSVFRDREGSLWIGLRGSGVDRWTGEGHWENWTRTEGLSSDMLWGLATDSSGRIWAGTSLGLSRIDPATGHVDNWDSPSTSTSRRAMSVAVEPSGRVWSGDQKGGLTRLDPQSSRRKYYGSADGLPIDGVSHLAIQNGDTLWVAGSGGVFKSSRLPSEPVRFTRFPLPKELPGQNYSDVLFDRDGCVWITSDHGLFLKNESGWHRYTAEDGLKSEDTLSVAILGESVWVSYQSPLGMTVIPDPHHRWSTNHLDTHKGLPSNMVYSLSSDGESIWAGTDAGLLRLRRSTPTNYSKMDGMVWDDCDTNGLLTDSSGVWVGTSRGLSHFKGIESGSAGNALQAPYIRLLHPLAHQAGNHFTLPWASRNFSLAWDSVNYRDEEKISYQFRLGDSDAPWTSTAGMETSFSNLPPGQQVFRIHALGPHGERSPDATLNFSISPPWWRTSLSELAGATLLITLAVLTGRFYSRRILRDKQKLELAVSLRTQELAEEKARAEIERERAECASRHKGEFLANMSHEIRTPMNGIIGMTDLLLTSTLTVEQAELANTVRQCGEHLLSVISDILDYSKIEAGFLKLESLPFDLRGTLSLVTAMSSPQASAKGLRLQVRYSESLPSNFMGDEGRVRQIVMNFVSNALKFTEKGSVEIDVRPVITLQGEAVRIEVRDTGCGIPPESLPSLFQQFVQVDTSTTRRHGGTGLGLAISKRLAELMGGTVGADSQLQIGSTFWAELPLIPAGSQPVKSKPTRSSLVPLERSLRVLVAEDNAVNQKLIVRMLQRLNCDVQLAKDGLEALEQYSSGTFDVILMDCQMPGLDGYEVTQRIRLREAESCVGRTPIIALTAHAVSGDGDRCFEAGMDLYLTKPISMEDLRRVLAEIGSGKAPLDTPGMFPFASPAELAAQEMGRHS